MAWIGWIEPVGLPPCAGSALGILQAVADGPQQVVGEGELRVRRSLGEGPLEQHPRHLVLTGAEVQEGKLRPGRALLVGGADRREHRRGLIEAALRAQQPAVTQRHARSVGREGERVRERRERGVDPVGLLMEGGEEERHPDIVGRDRLRTGEGELGLGEHAQRERRLGLPQRQLHLPRQLHRSIGGEALKPDEPVDLEEQGGGPMEGVEVHVAEAADGGEQRLPLGAIPRVPGPRDPLVGLATRPECPRGDHGVQQQHHQRDPDRGGIHPGPPRRGRGVRRGGAPAGGKGVAHGGRTLRSFGRIVARPSRGRAAKNGRPGHGGDHASPSRGPLLASPRRSPRPNQQESKPIVGSVLKGGTLVELEPAQVERADLRVVDGSIVARGPDLAPEPGDEVISLEGRLVLPGLVSGHMIPASIFVRGLPLPVSEGDDPLPPRVQLRHSVEQVLDATGVQVAAAVSGLEALQCGTTTVVASHASPQAVEGSLMRLARGFHEVGLRGILSYAVSDRAGAVRREQALEESVAFAVKAQGRFRGGVGIGGLGDLSEEGLEGVRQALERIPGRHLNVELAEYPQDGRRSRERHGETPVARLLRAGLLGPHACVAHLVHLDWPELSEVITTGAWLIHAARSDMVAGVGHAPVGKFGARIALGSGSQSPDLLLEAQVAHHRAVDAGSPVDVLRALANGHRLASEVFGTPIGPLREGALADLVVLDYAPPTPLTAETLASHLVEGLSSRHVESVMIDGHWRLWARRPLTLNPTSLAEQAREVAAGIASQLAATRDAGVKASSVVAAESTEPEISSPSDVIPESTSEAGEPGLA